MKRDMDLIRKILFYVEENYKPMDQFVNVSIPEYDHATLQEHCVLAFQAGLVNKVCVKCGSCIVYNLTNAGYDYLDKIRNDTIWNKTKDTIKKKGLPLVIDTIKTVANAFVTATAEGVANAIIKNGGQV